MLRRTLNESHPFSWVRLVDIKDIAWHFGNWPSMKVTHFHGRDSHSPGQSDDPADPLNESHPFSWVRPDPLTRRHTVHSVPSMKVTHFHG